jgi:hypothetical protein
MRPSDHHFRKRNRKWNPVFTLPYSEFCVAQQLARLLPAAKGYSLYVPLSRQQKGVDLLIARRRNQRIRVASIQVKSSRTYSRPKIAVRAKDSFRYGTWFNNFKCPSEADFFCLVSLYPAVDAAQRRELGTLGGHPKYFSFHKRKCDGS